MRALIVTLAVLLSGCAATSSPRVSQADEQQVNAIYAGIEAATARFGTSAELLSGGDVAAARQEHDAARAALVQLGDRCVNVAGCDARRVIAAQDAMLLLSGFAGPGSADAIPADEAIAIEGEGDTVSLQALPRASRPVSMLNGRDLAKVIELNEPVKAALEEWLTWMRPQLLDTWENYQYMRHLMFPEYERSGLPEALLFGIMAKESNGKVHAVSRAGAAGPLQFMPATGARFGLARGGAFDLRFDPGASARANAAYLHERFAELNDSLALALAAYNGGEGRIARLSNRGARDFWSPQVFNALPPETREYVPMVLAAAWLFLHPERYNLEFAEIDTRAASVVLEQPTSLNEIAVCLGQQGNARGWFRHVRNLNPRWEPHMRLATGTQLSLPLAAQDVYQRECRSGPMLAMSRELHDAKRPQVASRSASRGASYTVRAGDSLHSISRARGCDVRELASANGVRAPRYLIRAGQKLSLSGCSRG